MKLIVNFCYRYFHDSKSVYLVLEYASNGELFKALSKAGGVVDEATCRCYMNQIALAIKYLHERNVAHRDIKPENILICDNGVLKLADLGWSAVIPVQGKRMTMCGTPEYLCPEMISGSGHSVEVDLWALGIMMYELMIGRTPFFERKKTESEFKQLNKGNKDDTCSIEEALEQECRSRVYAKIKSHNGGHVSYQRFSKSEDQQKAISDGAKSIIRAFLQPVAKKRMTAEVFLMSEWSNIDASDGTMTKCDR